MKLSIREYDAMQSGWRKWINEHMEISGFKAWGIRSLGKIFCMTDTTSYENLRRHVTFIRHSDLSDGDVCHDEIIRRRKSQ